MLQKLLQKTAEATWDIIGNKIADKITSIGKTKEKEKTKENTKEIEEIYIPPEKKTKTNKLDCFECNSIEHKMCTFV